MRSLVSPLRSVRDRDEGAAAVEFAILTPLIFGILFGIITLGLAWNSKQTLTYAAREGARFGATLALDESNMSDWLDQVITHTQNASEPDLSLSEDGAGICVTYIAEGVAHRKFTGDAPSHSSWCFEDNRSTHEARVQVRVSQTVPLITILLPTDNVGMSSHASARHELTETSS